MTTMDWTAVWSDAESALTEAELFAMPADRYAAAHRAALLVATAVLAARSTPQIARVARREPGDVWSLVAHLAPELGEWAVFFHMVGPLVSAGSKQPRLVTERQADDLLRDAQGFRDAARRCLRHPGRLAVWDFARMGQDR